LMAGRTAPTRRGMRPTEALRFSPGGKAALVAVALALCLHGAAAFYLPGVAPRTFKDGQPVNIKVQTLVSSESQLQFDYYQLPFCQPPKIVDLPENLGEALAGEKAHTSPFRAHMKENVYCQTLCRKEYTPAQMEEFQDFAILEYRVNMRLDNLPVAEIQSFYYDDRPDETVKLYNLGFSVGTKLHEEVHTDEAVTEHYVLNNHLRFKILWHAASHVHTRFDDHQSPDSHFDLPKGSLIVGFQVQPFSVKHTYNGKWNTTCAPNCPLTTCAPQGQFNEHKAQRIDTPKGGEVIWTYDVVWEESDVMWASRWDVYLSMTNDNIHWFSIINSIVILVFLSGIVGMIFSRILRNDLQKYNADAPEDPQALREETGWKLVHGDIFRSPPMAQLLSVYVATGMQLLLMSILTLILAALGFFSPAHRGSLLGGTVVFFLLSGAASGFVAARFSKLFAEENKIKVTFLTAFVFPGACAAIFFALNLLIWTHQSSGAVPIGTLLAVMVMWFCISVPLTFLGAYLGYRQPVMEVPCRTNQIPREVPPQAWYLSEVPAMLIGGLLPFGAVFVELFFILSSIWQHRFYYMFGFLMVVFLVFLLTCAEICVVLCYLQICSEDYRWWWRSFLTGASSGLYLLAYGGYHYLARTHHAIDVISSVIYFGYLAIVCYSVSVCTGAVGFLACYFFVRFIYASVKID